MACLCCQTLRKVSFQSRFCWPCCRLPLSWLSVPCGTALTDRLCSQCFTFPAPCPALVPLHASTVAGEDGMHPCEGQVAGECEAGSTWERDGSSLVCHYSCTCVKTAAAVH